MREKIEGLQEKFDRYQIELQGKLRDVIEIITGVVTPDKSLNNIAALDMGNLFNFHSRNSSMSIAESRGASTPKNGGVMQFGDTTNKRKMQASGKQKSKLIKGSKDPNPLSGPGNNLFMSINTLALE